MKQKIIILTTIYLLFNSPLSAQNIEKMNNSELIEHIVNLITKIDSIKNDNINLQESTSKLSSNLSLLEQKNKTNDVEISRISELILKNELTHLPIRLVKQPSQVKKVILEPKTVNYLIRK